jgi:RNA polymerase sigma-70 factor, ECF subfamily
MGHTMARPGSRALRVEVPLGAIHAKVFQVIARAAEGYSVLMSEDNPVRELIERGDANAAAQFIVENYGMEVFGYVTSLLKDEDVASDAFSMACENVLKAVLTFRGESSVRTWFYTIARHAAYRVVRTQRRRREDRISALAPALQAPVRTATAAFQRTEVKDEFAKLREALSDEDRELLLLRVDRRLSFTEIASVLNGLAPGQHEELKREAARCRKQFERIKLRLRELAIEAGLLQAKD